MTAIISLTDGVKRNQSIATAYELTLFQSTNIQHTNPSQCSSIPP